jgi:two-component system, sensor histidine kinase LadS
MKSFSAHLTFVVLLCLTVGLPPAEAVELDDAGTVYRPGEAALRLLYDEGNLSANEAYAKLTEFRPFDRSSVQIARDGAIWLLLELENRTDRTDWIVANAMNVELLELYQREGDQWRLSAASGNAIPFADRDPATRHPAFRITIPAGESERFLLRTMDLQSSSVRLEISEAEEFWSAYRDQTLLLGLAFGFFLALIVSNAIVFLVNRDPTYLVYSLYMTAFAVNQLAQERLLVEYVQPHAPHGFFWFVVFGGLTAALGVEFFRRLIETRARMPRADLAMRGVQVALGAVVVAGFVAPGPVAADVLNVLSLVAMGLIVYVLIARIVKRDALAIACLVGSLLYLAGTTAEIVSVLVPVQVGGFALHAQLYGALAQVLILSFALGSKTHRVQEEYRRAQHSFRTELEKRVHDRTEELRAATERLEQESVTDELTGLYNRKELNRRSAELDNRRERSSGTGERYSVTVAYIDLDDFKRCNDVFGHGFGDDLLRRTAAVIGEQTRGYDVAFRVGGDEFVIIMPDTTLESGRVLVERIQKRFAAAMPPEAPVSMSIGLASTAETPALSVAGAIDAADSALLSSKARGKNRVSTAADAARSSGTTPVTAGSISAGAR